MPPGITSIRFDQSQWTAVEKKGHIHVWCDDVKDLQVVLSLEFFDRPPEIAISLEDLDKVRFLYRNIANQSGAGLISGDVIPVFGIDSIETIFKLPQDARGVAYIGSLTIPFADFSFVVKVQSIERGLGTREATVLREMIDGGIALDKDGKPAGWERDPYDPSGDYPCMPTMAEQTKYDDRFPSHALSRVRNTLREVRNTISFAPELKGAKKFSAE